MTVGRGPLAVTPSPGSTARHDRLVAEVDDEYPRESARFPGTFA
ncbi:hypothetical protein B005_0264 [Nocardiopsis alba ATCC BAA-2165]|uniref:Uncharacterized protein n=1 Tax=Nocardiopsis alba (strain ATCC BAA-2165 / BE74) TaxID=1205910 RepID=J7L575_NOCAA|nr:hypothetical protein B005_0264 [Nocardiopsis alba ATCC BAA-2165]